MHNQTAHWQHWVALLEKELTVEMLKAPSPSEVHARDHILRVLKRCIRLGEKLDADLEILVKDYFTQLKMELSTSAQFLSSANEEDAR